MKVEKMQHGPNKFIQHHPGVTVKDSALCGLDLLGDEFGFGESKVVEGKVTCPDCARIIDACRKVDRSEYVLSRNGRIVTE